MADLDDTLMMQDPIVASKSGRDLFALTPPAESMSGPTASDVWLPG
jgi:hypothetical protein